MDGAAKEMLYDALYLSIRNLSPPPLPAVPRWLANVSSSPSIDQWSINWRPESNHVVIVFSDEPGQTYTDPSTTQRMIIDIATSAQNLSIYSFSGIFHRQNPRSGWEPISVGGSWATLTSNANQMFDEMMRILDETACGEGAERGASNTGAREPFYFASFIEILFGFTIPPGATNNWLHLPTRQCIHPAHLME